MAIFGQIGYVVWLFYSPFSKRNPVSIQSSTTDFDDIRPYDDHEVRPTLDRILREPELGLAIASFKFPRLTRALPWLMGPLVRLVLKRQLVAVNSVDDLQRIVKDYIDRMLAESGTELSSSGLEKLEKDRAYLFVSNHRDIAMDPAFVNWMLFSGGFHTLRIAIGDNLLTKPYVSDLMRLNKSFIVNRSAQGPRQKFKAAKRLSAYIHHSIVGEGANNWIAQREGRAKDGRDKTNSAIVGMFALNKPKPMAFGDYIKELNIVPVSISYELDPCDAAKARELHAHRTDGDYEKDEHEDVDSIAAGIVGKKGRVHVAFGDVLDGDFDSADQVVAELDRQIIDNYVLQASNCLAYEQQTGEPVALNYGAQQQPFAASAESAMQAILAERLEALPAEHRDLVLDMYANPVKSKREQLDAAELPSAPAQS